MTFGEKLVNLRERHGMSQEELAEKLDVSRQTISNWENDKVKIDVDKAIEICQLFDVDLNSLFLTPNMSQLAQCKSQTDINLQRERASNKRLVILTVISSVMLVVTIVLVILSAFLLSQSYDNKFQPSMTSQFTYQDGYISLLVGSSLIFLISAAILIFCCVLLIRSKHGTK